MSKPKQQRIAIIGGGVSGLAAAWHLHTQSSPESNIDVHIFEADSRLGGHAHTLTLNTTTFTAKDYTNGTAASASNTTKSSSSSSRGGESEGEEKKEDELKESQQPPSTSTSTTTSGSAIAGACALPATTRLRSRPSRSNRAAQPLQQAATAGAGHNNRRLSRLTAMPNTVQPRRNGSQVLNWALWTNHPITITMPPTL